MKKISSLLALTGLLIVSPTVRAQFADAVISYTSGSGVSASFTNPNTALGAPASGSAVTPFAPPFSNTQIVSIGAGGSLTLQLDTPILNNSSDPFGIDFIIFGNTFFALSGSTASGTLGGNNTGSTLVEVSADDVNWFTLNPVLAPTVDGIFPTDGTGNPLIPVDPSLTATSFAGQNLAGVRSLYDGSAGGTGFDLAWAQDSEGDSVDLASADFVRFDVLSGKSEVDAIAVVPEPSVFALILSGAILLWLCRKKQKLQPAKIMRVNLFLQLNLFAVSICGAATFTENFTGNPSQDGWKVFGDTNLFQWNSTNQNLAVTWDSSQTNSYFYHSLGTVLTRNDDFSVAFDFQLNDIASGTEPGKTGGFEIAFGFLNFTNAADPNFMRGVFGASSNEVEFDYFPPGFFSDFGPVDATVSPTVISSDAMFASSFNDPYELPTNQFIHVTMNYTAANQTLTTTVTTNGTSLGAVQDVVLTDFFSDTEDFRADTFSISSFSGVGDDFDSVLAHGLMTNLVVTVPPPPVQNLSGNFSNGVWQVQFISRTNWLYTLQRTANFQSWADAAIATAGNGTNLFLQDLNSPADKSFYRVSAQRP